uniref:Uncharacterized protein n=1 Tax=Arundo donax TaxID=35708 RepID=A0A0A9BLJ9_ARUDO
MFSLCICT